MAIRAISGKALYKFSFEKNQPFDISNTCILRVKKNDFAYDAHIDLGIISRGI